MMRGRNTRRLPAPRRSTLVLVAALGLALVGGLVARPGHAGVERWTPLGPFGGSFELSFDPFDPKTFYAASREQGWKSVDRGQSWWQALPGRGGVIVADPFHRGTLFRASGGSIVKSVDAGRTWATVYSAFVYGSFVNALVADPHLAGAFYAVASADGVLRTLDGGATWQQPVTGVDFRTSAYSRGNQLAADPVQAGTMYLATDQGVLRSTDSGSNFGPQAVTASQPQPGFLSVLAGPPLVAGGPATLYAVPVHAVGDSCLVRSADGGVSWTGLPRPAALPPPPPVFSLTCSHFAAVDPEDARRLYLVELDGILYRSRDAGGSWEVASPGLAPKAIFQVWVDPHDSAVLYANSDPFSGSILKSSDGGSSWQPSQQGFSATQIAFLAAPSAVSATLYAGQAQGPYWDVQRPVWKTTDHGQSWAPLAGSGGSVDLAVDPYEPAHLLLANGALILASRDGGATWTEVGPGPYNANRVIFHPFLRNTVYANDRMQGPFLSTDGGRTWQPRNTGLPGPACATDWCRPQLLSAIAFHPTNPAIFHAAFDGQIFATGDGGATWTASGFSDYGIGPLVVDPASPQTLYAGNCEGVWKTTDGGATWALAVHGIPQPLEDCVTALALDPGHSGTLYAGLSANPNFSSSSGQPARLFRSTDAAFTWSPLTLGLNGIEVTALLVEPGAAGRIFAATLGHGVSSGRFVGAQPLQLGKSVAAGGPPRFSVTSAWQDFTGGSGPATPVALTTETGYFWFFAPENLELATKVLDGAAVNGHVWAFYASLSSVAFEVTVADEATGAVRNYANPAGTLASVGDTSALPAAAPGATAPAAARRAAAAPAASSLCFAGPTALCFQGGRFRAEVSWLDGLGNSGAGQAVPVAAESGYFWFFGPGNAELFVKVLDGSAVNGHFWVFYGALSDVEYMLSVTDLVTGAVRSYHNPRGQLASHGDTTAFGTR